MISSLSRCRQETEGGPAAQRPVMIFPVVVILRRSAGEKSEEPLGRFGNAILYRPF